jgi:hypothetical protein
MVSPSFQPELIDKRYHEHDHAEQTQYALGHGTKEVADKDSTRRP